MKREDYRAGVLAQLLCNLHGAKKEMGHKFTPSDFFPSLAEDEAETWPTAEELAEKVKGMFGTGG